MQELKSILYNSVPFRQFNKILKESNLFIHGINGSLISFIIDNCFENISKKIVYISDDSEKIFRIKDDLDLICESEFVSAYDSEKRTDNEEQIKSLSNLSENNEFIVLVNSNDIKRNVLSKEKFRSSLIELTKNEEYLFEELLQKLSEYNFEKKDFVEETGDFSVRGGIVDLFPENYDAPLRIEFSGEQIESIREFDITTQRSVREINKIKIGINLSENNNFYDDSVPSEKIHTILDYIPDDAILFLDEPEIISEDFPDNEFDIIIKKLKLVLISQIPAIESSGKYSFMEINFKSYTQPDFHSNIKQLYNNLSEHNSKNINYIYYAPMIIF